MFAMSGFVIVFLIVAAIVAVAVIVIKVLAYNKRLDKIARGEVRDTHSAISDPGTTANGVYKVLMAVMMSMLLITVSVASGTISSLQTTVDSLQGKLDQMSRDVWNIQQQIRDSGKRVSSCEWEVRDPDYANRTATVDFTVVLRECSDDTEVTLSLDGQKTVLSPTQNAGEFKGAFTADIFKGYPDTSICIREGSRTYVEESDFYGEIYFELLPMPCITSQFDFGMKFGKLTYSGTYIIDSVNLEDIGSVTVTYLTNGREIKTFDATEQTLHRSWITLEQGMDLDKDLSIRVVIITKSGLRIEDQTAMFYEAERDYEDADYTRIVDMNGNVLWDSEKQR